MNVTFFRHPKKTDVYVFQNTFKHKTWIDNKYYINLYTYIYEMQWN